MRTFLFLCAITVAAAQYHYAPNAAPVNYAAAQGPGNENVVQQSTAQSGEYNKEFYSYAAPTQDFNDDFDSNAVLQGLKKNLRVVFIRGPESNGLENAALQLAKASAEDRTAIYVFNKQADIAALAQQLQNEHGQPHTKPEVHFVRYRTESDAQNAQRAIHAQYDSLPGLSTSHSDSTAAVINYASPAALHQTAPSLAVAANLPGAPFSIPPSVPYNYLPPQRFSQ